MAQKIKPIKILLIDDSESDAYLVCEHAEGHEIKVAHYLKNAQKLLKTTHFDLIITDVSLPDSFGLDIIQKLKKYAPVLVISGICNKKMQEAALRHGAIGVIDKNKIENLTSTVNAYAT